MTKRRHGGSKRLSWCQIVCHEVKNTSKICQNFVIKSQTFHDVKKLVIKSKRRHDVKRFIMWNICHDDKKARHDFKKLIVTLKTRLMTLKGLSWRQKLSWSKKNMSWPQWHQKHVFIIFCSRNDEQKCQDDKKVVKTSNISYDVKNTPWR